MYNKNFENWISSESCTIEDIGNYFGHKVQYVSMGRSAIYHIIKNCGYGGTVWMPVYACSSIRDAVEKAGETVRKLGTEIPPHN